MKFHITLLNLALFVGLINADEQQTRIINGRDAKIEQYPYQVSLGFRGKHICGGSIISKRHILTAAHCVDFVVPPYTDLTVHAGSSDYRVGGHIYRFADVKLHPNYRETDADLHHDIAVITLADTISFHGTTKKINLPSSDIRDRDKAVFTGWGSIHRYSTLPNPYLQQSRMTLVSWNRCKLQVRHLDEDQVCAVQFPIGGACCGDSGSPLVVNGEVVGIASYVVEECATGNADVFTKVYAYKSFINSVISRVTNTPSNPNFQPNPQVESTGQSKGSTSS